jgi:hypothetical protein
MAYGMLTSFALGAAQGLGGAIVNKLSKDQDAEIKAKADAEREARIEEAAIRSEGRAVTREDLKYNRMRTDTLADKATERADKVSDTEYQYAHEDIKAEQQHDWHVSDMNLEASLRAKADAAKELRDFKEKNNPDSIDYKVKVQQLEAAKQSIETSKQSVEASKSSIANQEITRQISEMELKNKKEIEDIRGQLKTEGDPTRSDNLKERLLLLEGKSTAPSFHVVDKPVIDPVTGQPQLNFKREPITTKVVVAINPITKEIKEINADPTSGVKYSKEEAEKIGRAKADAEIGERTSSLFNSDKDNTKEYDNFVAARAAELVGTPKAGGMLNSKGADKTTTDKVSTSTEAPFKAVDDPAKQKEYDIIFNKVVKPHESGNDGVNAKNPESSAGGTWQLVDDTAIQFGAKRGADGKVSNAEKDRVAPKYYAYVYKITDGDPAAMLAANFGQEAVSNAIGRAENKGTKWYDELKNPKLIQNMPQVYIRAKESIAELKAAGIDPDPRLLDFVNNYTSTKAVSANDSVSTIKRMNNG